jgi:hypothetical protein
VNPQVKNVLQGVAATAGAVGAYALGNTAAKQYRKTGYEETGSAFTLGAQQILNQYTQSTGQPAPNVSTNTFESGVSYSQGNNVSLNYPSASKFTLGHELGHQSIGKGNDIFRFAQDKTYSGLNPNVIGLATVGVGALVPSARRAASLALGINYLNHSGRIASEAEASRRGTKLLNEAGYPVSPAPGLYQAASYVAAPAVTALGGLAAGRFLRSFKDKLQ